MKKHPITAEEIYKFASRFAKYFLARKGLSLHAHRIDDATQDIALAGFENWNKTQNIAFTKKRICDRMKSWWTRHWAIEGRHPLPESQLSAARDYEDDSAAICAMRCDRRSDPVQEAAVRDFLEIRLTPRQRSIANFTAAGFSDEEIAAELGISIRTIQRERKPMAAKYQKEFEKTI